jgi:cobalt transporter subunit CbtB
LQAQTIEFVKPLLTADSALEEKMTANPSAGTVVRPVAIPVSQTMPWLVGALVLGLLLYYFIGIDEGATSVFGNSMMVHEFVHDARHFLGFPCH